jgi:hypothetical protein
MPKVIFSDAKGLYQQAGSGLCLQGELNYVPEVVNVTGTTATLTADQSGATVLLNNASNAAVVVSLPAGSTCVAGTWFRFVNVSANTHADGYFIQRGTDGELIVGGIPTNSLVDNKTEVAYSVATHDALRLTDITDDAGKAGSFGSWVELMFTGITGGEWQVIGGELLSAKASTSLDDLGDPTAGKVFHNVA